MDYKSKKQNKHYWSVIEKEGNEEDEGDEGNERNGRNERNAFQLTLPLSQLPLSQNLNNFFYTTPSITSRKSSISDISSQSFGPLDNYVYHELKPEQTEIFEQLLLNITIVCRFSFCWVKNLVVKELFK